MFFVCEVSVELDYLDYSFYDKQEAAFEVEYGFFFFFSVWMLVGILKKLFLICFWIFLSICFVL